MRGIVTRVYETRLCPADSMVFMLDLFSHPEVADYLFDPDPNTEPPEGIIILVPVNRPLLLDAARRYIGCEVDLDS